MMYGGDALRDAYSTLQNMKTPLVVSKLGMLRGRVSCVSRAGRGIDCTSSPQMTEWMRRCELFAWLILPEITQLDDH